MGEKLTYKDAGVDTKEGGRAVELMKDHVKRTFSENVPYGGWAASAACIVWISAISASLSSYRERTVWERS